MEFHHIGIATEDIEQMKCNLKDMFEVTDVSETVYDSNQDAYLCMLTINNKTKIELISGNKVEKLVKKRQFLYHICYEVEDIEVQIKKLIDMGNMLISEPKEAILFDNKKVAFLMTEMGLIELVEKV